MGLGVRVGRSNTVVVVWRVWLRSVGFDANPVYCIGGYRLIEGVGELLREAVKGWRRYFRARGEALSLRCVRQVVLLPHGGFVLQAGWWW